MSDQKTSISTSPEDQTEIMAWNEELNNDYYFTEEQRDRGDKNIRFANIPGAMWEGSDLSNFDKRIKMEFNRISKNINIFNSESETSRKTVKYRPEDRKDKGTARVLNGLYRKDFRRSGGNNAYDNAVFELSNTGIGHMHVSTDRANPEDLEDDKQKVIFDPIFNSYKTVVWDSNAKKIDKADAGHCHKLTSYTDAAFKKQWPDAEFASIGLPVRNELFFRWFDRGHNLIWVAERYEVKEKITKAIVLDNRDTGERKVLLPDDLKDIEDDLKAEGFKRSGNRKVIDKWVEKVVYSSTQILEASRRIPGKLIPIIPFYGYRAFVNGREYTKGLVDEHKDAQRLINMVLSKYAEISSTQPTEVPIFAPEQVAGLVNQWRTQHQGNKPYSLAKSLLGADGSVIVAGPTGTLKPPAVDQHSQLTLEFANNYIREEDAGAPEDFSDPDASDVAIGKILDRQNMDTQTLFTNIGKGVIRMGEVYRSIRADIALPDEEVGLLAEDNTESNATINETVLDEETGNLKVINDISKGNFETVVDTGPSFASLRKESVATLSSLLEKTKDTPAAQEYQPFILGALIQNIDGAGLEPLQEFNRNKMLASGFIEPETPEEEQQVEQAQQAANQPDPQQQAQQQLFEATAQKEAAEAQERQSKAQLNQATTEKTAAQTKEILAGIGQSQQKLQNDQNSNVIKFGMERAKLRQQANQQNRGVQQ